MDSMFVCGGVLVCVCVCVCWCVFVCVSMCLCVCVLVEEFVCEIEERLLWVRDRMGVYLGLGYEAWWRVHESGGEPERER